MLVFLDFEASSLGKQSYPIEVAWVFEDGREESHLIRPVPRWTDWDQRAEAIHGISRDMLEREGEEAQAVAAFMVTALSGHDLLASAPSWDGKWLSALLRAAGLPRKALTLRDSDDARAEALRRVVSRFVERERVEDVVSSVLTLSDLRSTDAPPAHRALPDARAERAQWLAVREAARQFAERHDQASRSASSG